MQFFSPKSSVGILLQEIHTRPTLTFSSSPSYFCDVTTYEISLWWLAWRQMAHLTEKLWRPQLARSCMMRIHSRQKQWPHCITLHWNTQHTCMVKRCQIYVKHACTCNWLKLILETFQHSHKARNGQNIVLHKNTLNIQNAYIQLIFIVNLFLPVVFIWR